LAGGSRELTYFEIQKGAAYYGVAH
jgi:hypothetical protein